MLKKEAIEIKANNFSISVIYIRHLESKTIFHAIQSKLRQAPNFLKNAPVILNIEYLNYNNIDWNKIQNAVLNNNLRIIGVSGCKDNNLRRMIEKNNLPIFTENKKNRNTQYSICTQSLTSNNSFKLKNNTCVIKHAVRAGQQIYAKNTDLIVINNVNPGAELVADGNIHVYGIMRGKALAGANGNEECQIFCINLMAELISIAGEFWIMDQIPKEFIGKPVRFFLNKNVLNIHLLK